MVPEVFLHFEEFEDLLSSFSSAPKGAALLGGNFLFGLPGTGWKVDLCRSFHPTAPKVALVDFFL